jgi:hypothetical protein
VGLYEPQNQIQLAVAFVKTRYCPVVALGTVAMEDVATEVVREEASCHNIEAGERVERMEEESDLFPVGVGVRVGSYDVLVVHVVFGKEVINDQEGVGRVDSVIEAGYCHNLSLLSLVLFLPLFSTR